MKHYFAIALLLPLPVFAASPFDGTWAVVSKSVQFFDKPAIYELDKNKFSCDSCTPPYTVKPDGVDHPADGSGAFDTVAAEIVDRQTVKATFKKNGKAIATHTFTVANDGMHAQSKTINLVDTKSVELIIAMKRVGRAPEPNQLPLTGSWVRVSSENSGPSGVGIYHMTNDGFQMSANGYHYDAKFDGNSYPLQGEGIPSRVLVSVRRVSATEVQETDTRDGKVIERIHLLVSPDGKTISCSETDVQTGSAMKYTLEKQGS